jgi:predicted amidophosphoribosyltransferase
LSLIYWLLRLVLGKAVWYCIMCSSDMESIYHYKCPVCGGTNELVNVEPRMPRRDPYGNVPGDFHDWDNL